MTIVPTVIGDNSQRPSTAEYLYNPDQLIAGGLQVVSANGTLKAGTAGQILKRGSVLGQQSIGGATSAAKAGGNTGNGTLTPDASTPVLANAQVGVYTVRLITAATNAGTWEVKDPSGDVIGSVAVGATFSNQIKFATADGATDFIVGDGFDITVAAGLGKYVLALAAATDGSQYPVAILGDDVDITADAVDAPLYLSGEFNGRALTLGTGFTLASVTPLLRALNIYVKSTVSASAET